MINNTLTLSEQYNVATNIVEYVSDENIIVKNLSVEDTLDAIGYLHSIELRRMKIKNELSEYFEFDNESFELEFLDNNSEIINVLPSIASYIKSNFDDNAKLSIELLNENAEWQTLFINIHSSADWETSNKFVDAFLENLYELYPNIAEKINLNIIPDEF